MADLLTEVHEEILRLTKLHPKIATLVGGKHLVSFTREGAAKRDSDPRLAAPPSGEKASLSLALSGIELDEMMLDSENLQIVLYFDWVLETRDKLLDTNLYPIIWALIQSVSDLGAYKDFLWVDPDKPLEFQNPISDISLTTVIADLPERSSAKRGLLPTGWESILSLRVICVVLR
jgi:hypothetical protein